MAESPTLSRKKKVRAAHRASVTRMIGLAQEMLGDEAAPDPTKLKQKRDALAAKAELLKGLDAEIVGEIHEDELEGEVENADMIQERIELAILELNTAQTGEESRPRVTSRTPTPSAEGRRGSPETHSDPPDRDEHEAVEATRVDSTPPADPGAILSSYSAHVKLPKLSLKKFNGELTKWTTFWDTFESAVHNNPVLTNIDKFSYLNSLLESTASEAIAGLTLTSANYTEAIATLKRRFGNKQLIVNRHMDLLLHLEAVASINNLKGIRQFFDAIESNVRGLRALGVEASSYGGLLSSILMSRLPSELRLVISRQLGENEWDLTLVMEILRKEIEARERSTGASSPQSKRATSTRIPPTALSLTTGTSVTQACVYCTQPHPSVSCQTVKEPEERKQILRTSGRCFVCLRRNHISRNCRSSGRCATCRRRHHTSICSASTPRDVTSPTETTGSASPRSAAPVPTTSSICVSSHTPILLQTVRARVRDAGQHDHGPTLEVRALLDTGSQRSYVTTHVQKVLHIRKSHSESMVIKTFGSEWGEKKVCDVVRLEFITSDNEPLVLPLVVVPHICDRVSVQPIDASRMSYKHLAGLELADSGDVGSHLEIDILIGSDFYWELVTGRVVKGDSGPAAIETRFGWVLSGPTEGLKEETAVNLVSSSHMLRVDYIAEPESLDAKLKRFWELESLGILKEEHPVQRQFTQRIAFRHGRYEVHLPWKEAHPHLPNNYELCQRRLTSLLKRLHQTPEHLQQYDSVIRDQLTQGIVEVVKEPMRSKSRRIHYLPHHGVVRHDKQTTKLRVVYDGSAKTSGPSLNECLYTGPNFGQNILHILLRFRLHQVALIGDIEKAFLMVSVADCDRDVLRFLWTADIKPAEPEIKVFRFTRVVFGVSASPFLLNATIDHHMQKLEAADCHFVGRFRRSIYVDDIATSAPDVEAAYGFYLRAKLHLAQANFNLRKFESNSPELRQRIMESEKRLSERDTQSFCPEDLRQDSVVRQVLGVSWNVESDELLADVSDLAQLMKETSPSKRNAISLATRFYDPLGIISPISVRFKQLFQRMCEGQLDWDEPLAGELLTEWERLNSDLQQFNPIKIPRCYQTRAITEGNAVTSFSLQGYCDASKKAYAAVVYLQMEDVNGVYNQFVCSKTRVAPVKKISIPRLELLSALLLARLLSTVQQALEPEIQLRSIDCHTDSQVALFWITKREREWKQFVQNRVNEIRELIPTANWRHCPGALNPADIPSRGASPCDLQEKLDLWLYGPPATGDIPRMEDLTTAPEGCLIEMKVENRERQTMTLLSSGTSTAILPCENYSCLKRLLRVTAYIQRFTHAAKGNPVDKNDLTLTADEIQRALIYWIKASQLLMSETADFQQWSRQFQLFLDDSGIWRCGGRLRNADILNMAKHPILLNKDHHLTTLIVRDCHERVMHGGVKATMTELRSRYWIIRGRHLIRKILHKCTICRRYQGKSYTSPPAPPLPPFRVKEAQPFSFTGVDFAGPLYVRDTTASGASKVWICLYTCCATRAIHLDLVPDLTTEAFIRCFKRFSARRGVPVRMISDNAKTFKSAANLVREMVEDPGVTDFFGIRGVQWMFNVERAPWWGGIFERMIQTAKRCLRKIVGNARLTHEELLTAVIEVEMIVNSRPLSYISSEDLEEPLTPSHLLCGHRILSLPDPKIVIETSHQDISTSRKDITRRMRHLSKILADFWRRWRTEYLLELREAHRYLGNKGGVKHSVNVGDVVVVHDENLPRGLWRLGRVEELMTGTDGKVRSVALKVTKRGTNPSTIRRPIQRLYPLEFNEQERLDQEHPDPVVAVPGDSGSTAQIQYGDGIMEKTSETRPRRQAFISARDTVRSWCDDLNSS